MLPRNQGTHRHQSTDRKLLRYSNSPRKKRFRAQRVLERKLADVFAIDGDMWNERDHQYVTQGQIKKMRSMARAKVSVTQIAKEVGVAKTTVYRWAGEDIKAAKTVATSK